MTELFLDSTGECTVEAIKAGCFHTLFLAKAGGDGGSRKELLVLGSNSHGQLGLDSKVAKTPTAVPLALDGEYLTQVEAGSLYSVALS